MPVSKNAKRCLAAFAALALLTSIARADFKVIDVQPHFTDNAIVINGDLQLALTRKVEEALSKGIELPVLFEIRLYRKRSLLWDERLAMWSLRRNLMYQALSGQYLVSADEAQENFLSLSEALKHLGKIGELRLPLPPMEEKPTMEHEYFIMVRAQLDIEALPTPLRPVAYTTLSWRLNSGWTSWNVAR